ncbi:MAG: hypothetical protein HYU66_17095 [Armatimonadetes bacterium]|nr:hypothetical protein [Armatimonadota bacterium]
MCPLQPAWLADPDRRERFARAGAIDWFAYAEDLFERTGAAAVPFAPAALLDPGALARVSALALPDLPPGGLSADQLALLERWTAGGGLLLGFATAAADALFGVRDEGCVEQPAGPFSESAAFRFTDPELALPLLHPDRPAPELVAFSPARLVRADGARPLAVFADGRPAVTLRRVGSGWAVLFAFDPAQTCWVLHQGRPVDQDYYPDGFFRSNDGLVLGERDPEVPYADLIVGLLRNLLALTRQPFVYQLPALDGELPDALFFWGGDDEGCPAEQNLYAAEFMHEQGLPYHVNIMPNARGEWHTPPDLLPVLRRLGTEPSLHLNFMDGQQHPFRYTAADVAAQVGWYRHQFGEEPICTVFHCTLWHGWTEPAEYLRAAGVEADNSRFGRVGMNPVNQLSYGAGTSLPYFVRLASGERLDFVCEAINAYEPGYQRDGRMELEPLQRTLSDAAWWHGTMNLFYHSAPGLRRGEPVVAGAHGGALRGGGARRRRAAVQRGLCVAGGLRRAGAAGVGRGGGDGGWTPGDDGDPPRARPLVGQAGAGAGRAAGDGTCRRSRRLAPAPL